MNKEQLINFSSQITKSLAQVEEAISVFKTDLVEATEKQTNFLQDGMDHAQEQSDLAARIEIHEGNMVRRGQLQNALARINQGTFGECVSCGELIDPRRLAALPSAACCVSCKQTEEGRPSTKSVNNVAWITPERLFSLCIGARAA